MKSHISIFFLKLIKIYLLATYNLFRNIGEDFKPIHQNEWSNLRKFSNIKRPLVFQDDTRTDLIIITY